MKLGQDEKRQKPKAVGNENKTVGKMERYSFDILSLVMGSMSCKASVSKPDDEKC